MALTEIQLPEKKDFYNRIRSTASQINNLVDRWRDLSAFIAVMDASDLDAMAIPAGVIRTNLSDFRNMLEEAINFFDGQAVAPAKNPSQIIDSLRGM